LIISLIHIFFIQTGNAFKKDLTPFGAY